MAYYYPEGKGFSFTYNFIYCYSVSPKVLCEWFCHACIEFHLSFSNESQLAVLKLPWKTYHRTKYLILIWGYKILTSKTMHFFHRDPLLQHLAVTFPGASPGTAPSVHVRKWRLGAIVCVHGGRWLLYSQPDITITFLIDDYVLLIEYTKFFKV